MKNSHWRRQILCTIGSLHFVKIFTDFFAVAPVGPFDVKRRILDPETALRRLQPAVLKAKRK